MRKVICQNMHRHCSHTVQIDELDMLAIPRDGKRPIQNYTNIQNLPDPDAFLIYKTKILQLLEERQFDKIFSFEGSLFAELSREQNFEIRTEIAYPQSYFPCDNWRERRSRENEKKLLDSLSEIASERSLLVLEALQISGEGESISFEFVDEVRSFCNKKGITLLLDFFLLGRHIPKEFRHLDLPNLLNYNKLRKNEYQIGMEKLKAPYAGEFGKLFEQLPIEFPVLIENAKQRDRLFTIEFCSETERGRVFENLLKLRILPGLNGKSGLHLFVTPGRTAKSLEKMMKNFHKAVRNSLS